MFFVESSENSHLCPVCQGMLRYRDSRPRIRKKEGGMRERLMIRRFRCQNCHSYHNELPDCLVPYKHYEAEVIAGVLDEVILPDDLDSEDYPSFNTMLRWLQWFRENEYYGTAEPPVRCGESHLSGLTEPPHFVY